eukprot:3042996-Pyramimonas_sp.AAC.2
MLTRKRLQQQSKPAIPSEAPLPTDPGQAIAPSEGANVSRASDDSIMGVQPFVFDKYYGTLSRLPYEDCFVRTKQAASSN